LEAPDVFAILFERELTLVGVIGGNCDDFAGLFISDGKSALFVVGGYEFKIRIKGDDSFGGSERGLFLDELGIKAGILGDSLGLLHDEIRDYKETDDSDYNESSAAAEDEEQLVAFFRRRGRRIRTWRNRVLIARGWIASRRRGITTWWRRIPARRRRWIASGWRLIRWIIT